VLDGHEIGAYYISWSPDDQHLIVCGPEDCNELCVWDIEVSCENSDCLFLRDYVIMHKIHSMKDHQL
jgi:WD40 repeat protein